MVDHVVNPWTLGYSPGRAAGGVRLVADWWGGAPDERYWCEITDRGDIGEDLKCPQTNEEGGTYWSYELIHQIQPGDIVYHYSTPQHAFVGASVAGGPIEPRPIRWQPHGTVGRSKTGER